VECREYKVAGLCRPQCYLRGFAVANFADEDNVWVLPQDGTQRRGERESAFFVDLYLVRAMQRVFHGVFYCGDVDVAVDDFA
jgi:hypothetical protein